MRSAVELAARPDFAVRTVFCRDDHRGWSAVEHRTEYGLVLVRSGRFRRRAAGVVTDVDTTVGYVSLPGDEEHFAHPAGGDVCTAVSYSGRLWWSVAGEDHRPELYVDAALEFAHRRFLAAAGTGDTDFALAETLVTLLGIALRRTVEMRAADRVLVSRAREAILEDHPASAGLLPLSTLLSVSPYRLSRAFSRHLGTSLTRYRNRVRVGRALDRLEAGEPNLAALAADLGFADQAHLTRTVREHVGHTPAALRHLLAHACS
ncbi:AraC family transcriptional regulator [Amycolatopsis cynarae]|uniref:AraC family transcriptional regulator n=1 Tax=Amycolatopsis cynarae TaxID=2995223 RepID=A0ABY7B0N1_9PSEU|nr:AraC family transcriptional regulator [Amycolatopsis sp. HUAS 11-8]WAL64777.1 AraC family transcriptional regulator [Amycolatopsis sp. HUAS 11-8]